MNFIRRGIVASIAAATPDGEFSYRLNAPAELLALSVPGSEKLTPSADEQSGAMTLTFSGAARMALMAGNFDMANPTTIEQINYLKDMSYGTGDFVYELHVDWPATTELVTGTYNAGAQLATIEGHALVGSASLYGEEGTTTIVTVRIYDDSGVKKYAVWKDGVPSAVNGSVIGVDIAVGIDLAELHASLFTQEPVDSTVDQTKFVSPTPSVVSRLVTDPAEMVFATSLLPRTANTIIGNGQVVIEP